MGSCSFTVLFCICVHTGSCFREISASQQRWDDLPPFIPPDGVPGQLFSWGHAQRQSIVPVCTPKQRGIVVPLQYVGAAIPENVRVNCILRHILDVSMSFSFVFMGCGVATQLIFPVLPATLPSRLLTNVPHFDGQPSLFLEKFDGRL